MDFTFYGVFSMAKKIAEKNIIKILIFLDLLY